MRNKNKWNAAEWPRSAFAELTNPPLILHAIISSEKPEAQTRVAECINRIPGDEEVDRVRVYSGTP